MAKKLLDQHFTLGRLSKEPRLAVKVAIISGASRGFDQAIAIRFVGEAAKVVLCSLDACDETAEIISNIKGIDNVSNVALNIQCDIADEHSIKSMLREVEKTFGSKLHILVNNAATFVFHSVESGTMADWQKSFTTNIIGSAMITKYCIPFLKQGAAECAAGASIIFQGSISSFLAQPNCATYSVTKAAVAQMVKNCAYDLAIT